MTRQNIPLSEFDEADVNLQLSSLLQEVNSKIDHLISLYESKDVPPRETNVKFCETSTQSETKASHEATLERLREQIQLEASMYLTTLPYRQSDDHARCKPAHELSEDDLLTMQPPEVKPEAPTPYTYAKVYQDMVKREPVMGTLERARMASLMKNLIVENCQGAGPRAFDQSDAPTCHYCWATLNLWNNNPLPKYINDHRVVYCNSACVKLHENFHPESSQTHPLSILGAQEFAQNSLKCLADLASQSYI